jgi:predicted lysophospholipase L1 biosynthesis ABC-type transport system permease subunit
MNLLSYYINFIFSQKKTQILVLILGQLFYNSDYKKSSSNALLKKVENIYPALLTVSIKATQKTIGYIIETASSARINAMISCIIVKECETETNF